MYFMYICTVSFILLNRKKVHKNMFCFDTVKNAVHSQDNKITGKKLLFRTSTIKSFGKAFQEAERLNQ